MLIEIEESVLADLEACQVDLAEFEDQIRRVSPDLQDVQLAVTSLSPGRSGALVCLVRRLHQGRALKPLLVKTAKDVSLLICERNNYNNHVRDRWPRVPQLLSTGSSRLLIYEYEGFLHGLQPSTLKQGYRQSSPSALAALMRQIVNSLQEVHAFQADNRSFISRLTLPSPLVDRLRDHTSLPQDIQQSVVQAWEDLQATGTADPALYVQSIHQHGDLNVGNILFQPGDQPSLPVFIDFGMMESGLAKGYAVTGQAPFWDYAKLERDIKTRLFVVDAAAEGLDRQAIRQVIQHVDGGSPLSGAGSSGLASSLAVQRLQAALQALRQAIQASTPPDRFSACYRISVAFATLCVFYRPEPDDNLDLALQHRIAAESVLALLSPEAVPPAQPASPPPALTPNLIVRSWSTPPPFPAGPDVVQIDLSDLFDGRQPRHLSVWSHDIPQRLAAALPAIRSLGQPLRPQLFAHLSIAWSLGALLNPKAGYQLEPLQLSGGQTVFWPLAPGRLPPGAEGWLVDCVDEGEGTDLALVISVSKPALAEARQAIPRLNLPLAATYHASLPEPGNGAIVDGSHARWLADALILAIHGLRAEQRPQRLHLFPACPVAFLLLLGQQAEACGPTTVYEFAYGEADPMYSAGMATGQ